MHPSFLFTLLGVSRTSRLTPLRITVRRIVSLAPFLLAAPILPAQSWTLVDDFSDPTFPGWVITSSGDYISGYEPFYEEEDEVYLSLVYPEGYEESGPTSNSAMIQEVLVPVDWMPEAFFYVRNVPVSLLAEGQVTLYFQYYQQDRTNTLAFGMTTKPLVPYDPPPDPPIRSLYLEPKGWSDYAFLFRIGQDCTINFRDGHAYRLAVDYSVENFTWYEVWIVATNAPGAETSASGDTYQIWIQGGEYEAPTQVMLPPQTPGDPERGWAEWRNPSENPLANIMIAGMWEISRSVKRLPKLIDDLYLTEGAYPGVTPAGATVRVDPTLWGIWPIESSVDGPERWVNTGNFLGTIALPDDYVDNHWVFSYRLRSWVWVDPADLNDRGGWAYVRNGR